MSTDLMVLIHSKRPILSTDLMVSIHSKRPILKKKPENMFTQNLILGTA